LVNEKKLTGRGAEGRGILKEGETGGSGEGKIEEKNRLSFDLAETDEGHTRRS